jgi:hypothetical protein
MFSRRTLTVAVAVVFEPELGFFLSYNPHWGGYALPMRKRRMTDVDLPHSALEALRDATDLPLRGARVEPLTYLEVKGASQRTGKETVYRYHVFQVDPPVVLSAEVAPLGFACQRGFVKPSLISPCATDHPDDPMAIRAGTASVLNPATGGADLVTWSTRRIIDELTGNQRVAVAVICRRGANGIEYLMNRNANYGGYFPIAARCRTEGKPRYEVREAVKADTGYRPLVDVGTHPVEVEDRHFSPRFQCERRFVFSLLPVTFHDLDLGKPDNELEVCLDRSGLLWDWVTDDKLDDPGANGLSPTITTIRDAMRLIAARHGPCSR